MLASTMQFSTNNPVTPAHPPPKGTPTKGRKERTTCAGKPETTRPTPPKRPRPAGPPPDHPAAEKPPHGQPGNEPTRTRHHDKKEPCYLRTQQCAKHHDHDHDHPPAFHAPTNTPTHQDTITRPCHDPKAPPRTVLTARRPPGPHLFVDIPPMSTHRGTNARAMG